MENRDTLSLIYARLDDSTLLSLWTYAMLRDEITELFGINSFWKARVEHLLGYTIERTSESWRDVYYAVKGAREEADPSRVLLHGMKNLDALLFLEEMYGRPANIGYQRLEEMWNEITSVDVLRLVAAYDGGYWRVEAILVFLLKAIGTGDVEQINATLTLLSDHTTERTYRDNMYNRYGLLYALTLAAKMGDIKSVRRLLYYTLGTGSFKYAEILKAIARSHDAKMWQLTVNLLGSNLDPQPTETAAFLTAAEEGDVATVQFLIEQDEGIMHGTSWRDLLNDAIANDRVEFVRYVLTKISPASKGNQALKKAAARSIEMFELVFSDPRIDPMSDLPGLLSVIMGPTHSKTRNVKVSAAYRKAVRDIAERPVNLGHGWYSVPSRALDLLVKDKRVLIEKMDRTSIRLLLSGLQKNFSKQLEGAARGAFIVEGIDADQTREQLSTMIERSYHGSGSESMYALLFLFILLKRPTPLELIDWMIARRDPVFMRASDQVLRCRAGGEVPIRALLISLLHPTMTLEDVINRLRSEGGMSDANLLASAQLVGAFLASE